MIFTQIVPFRNGKYLIDYKTRFSSYRKVARFDDLEEAKQFVKDCLPEYMICKFPDGSKVRGEQ